MTSLTTPLLRILPTMLFCLTLTGAADAAGSTGPVVGWGDDGDGQATPPVFSGTATDIATGSAHSCAIQAGTGNAVCWGYDALGQATPPDAVNGVSGTATDIAAGSWHTLAIVADPEPTATPSERVAVCHNGKNSISVSADAVTTHLTHGDALGACP